MPNQATIERTQQKRISPVQRNLAFAQATRQNWQMLPAVTAAAGATVTFDVPKVRLLSRIRLLVTATLTVTHESNTSYTPATFAPWSLLRQLRVGINNGFNPFSVSGIGCYLYNLLRDEAAILAAATSGRNRTVLGLTASAGGTANPLRMVVDLPITFNDRDPYGLILTQNQETQVTVAVDLGQRSDIAPDASGYTFELSDITIQPMVETFSVPVTPEAIPDLSLLKLVHEQYETVVSGVNTVKLPPGMTYRKLIMHVTDAAGAGLGDDAINGLIELVLNQSDIPYRINPYVLSALNQEWYGIVLPAGVYVFDFTYQGLANYGGSRDYIDTERLTEFWLRFPSSSAGRVRIVSEQIAKLM